LEESLMQHHGARSNARRYAAAISPFRSAGNLGRFGRGSVREVLHKYLT
jgi:hypothetical protein